MVTVSARLAYVSYPVRDSPGRKSPWEMPQISSAFKRMILPQPGAILDCPVHEQSVSVLGWFTASAARTPDKGQAQTDTSLLTHFAIDNSVIQEYVILTDWV